MNGYLGNLIKDWPPFWRRIMTILLFIGLPISLAIWILILDLIDVTIDVKKYDFLLISIYSIGSIWYFIYLISDKLIKNRLEKERIKKPLPLKKHRVSKSGRKYLSIEESQESLDDQWKDGEISDKEYFRRKEI